MKILKPTVGGHDGSSFRELLDLWAEAGYCEVVPNTEEVSSELEESMRLEARPWVNAIGDVLLYDNPILDKLHDGLSWNLALFANTVHDGDGCYPWTFWPRRPRLHEQMRNAGIPSYGDRSCESTFIGSYTTGYRSETGDWSNTTEHFWMGYPNQREFDQVTYLKHLKDNKFGLCLRGIGPKCLRDMELIGFGTVPIFTPGVSTNYYNTLEKDKHYLYADSPLEAKEVIGSCSKDKWDYMSNECIKWFDNNSSTLGSFELTKKIVETHS